MEKKPEIILQMTEDLFRRQIELTVTSMIEIFRIGGSGFDPNKYASDFSGIFTEQFIKANTCYNNRELN